MVVVSITSPLSVEKLTRRLSSNPASLSCQADASPAVDQLSVGRLPPELVFEIVEIAFVDHVHGYMVNDTLPEWDALRIFLQVDTVWRDVAGKLISSSLGIDRDENGKYVSLLSRSG